MSEKRSTPTVHNEAIYGDIASVVIMPGDPMRAKYISEHYLNNSICFNKIRGMLGYTGEYKGKRVSVMGSGMGIPSMGIYSYELYNFYGVEKIIRIGSCGSYTNELELGDIILAEKVTSTSNFAKEFCNVDTSIVEGSKVLQNLVLPISKDMKINVKKGNIETSECFYHINRGKEGNDINSNEKHSNSIECLAVEMETYALFNVAKLLNKEAISLLTVTDFVTGKSNILSASDRERRLDDMIMLALEVAIH